MTAAATGAVPAWLRRSRAAVFVYFCVLGTGTSTWAARLPAIKTALHLSDGTLGLALFAAPCGSVLTLVLSGRMTDRFGAVRVTRVAGLILVVPLLAIGLARNLPELMLALMCYGAAGGLLDVSMNACGARIEAGYRRPVLSSLHGGYSIAGLAGAGIAGLFAAAGIGTLPTLAAAAALIVLAGGTSGRYIRLPAAAARPERSAGTGSRPARQITIVIALLGLLALCGQLGEGAAGDWSAVYLHVNLGAPAGEAAMGIAAFSVTMAAGRVAGDWLARRLGSVLLLRCSGLVAGLGLLAGLAVRNAAVAIAGFALLGAGLACIFPQVVSVTARLDTERAGRNIGRIAAVAYLGLLGGPVVIGAVASGIGLRGALLIPAVLGLVVALLSGLTRIREHESFAACRRDGVRSCREQAGGHVG